MENYVMIKKVGSDSYGSIYQALHKRTGQIVAIKKMKTDYYSWNHCRNMREVKLMRKLNHPNILRLNEVILKYNTLYLVFEFTQCNLYQIMNGGIRFTEKQIKHWCFQILQALAHIHGSGIVHRDLRPANLLITNDSVKIANFGHSRQIDSGAPYTEYVATRWYRPPEILLQSTAYDPAVDMWAMGAILAELFNFSPLFPGSSSADQMLKICSIIGSPNMKNWLEGIKRAEALNYLFPQLPKLPLSFWIPTASEDAISLIESLCSWDPCKRPTASEAMQHPFFSSLFHVQPFLRPRGNLARMPPIGTRRTQAKEHRWVFLDVVPNLKTTDEAFPKPPANVQIKKTQISPIMPPPGFPPLPKIISRAHSSCTAEVVKHE